MAQERGYLGLWRLSGLGECQEVPIQQGHEASLPQGTPGGSQVTLQSEGVICLFVARGQRQQNLLCKLPPFFLFLKEERGI